VGRYLAARPDHGALLDFDERPNLALFAYAATVKVDQRRVKNFYVFPKRNAVSNRHFSAVSSLSGPVVS
jgi:hypothetical protein